MRLDPETFDKIFYTFIGLILLFFAYAGVKILAFESRRRNPLPPPKKPPGPGGETATTFGLSGIGASDVAPAAIVSMSNDVGSGDTSGSDSGGDSGGDFSGGGGESGGGGSSGGW